MWFKSVILVALVLFTDLAASKAHDQHIRTTKHSAAGRSSIEHLPENLMADALPARHHVQEDTFMNPNPEVRSSGRKGAASSVVTKHSATGRSLRAEMPMESELAQGAWRDHGHSKRSLVDPLPENADAIPARREVLEDTFLNPNPEVRSSGIRSAAHGVVKMCNVKDPKAPKCPSSLKCCKRSCKNLQSDDANCGRCGKRCGPYQSCCAGVCSLLLADARNCGRCGVRCKAGATCFQSMCNYAA